MKPVPRLRPLALLSALSTAATGFWALNAWRMGDWWLLSLGPDYIPMAPPTAILFVILGLALAAQLRWPESRAARLSGTLGSILALLVGGLAILQSALDLTLPWDTWMLARSASVRDIPVGRMSPLTALAFAFSALGLLAGFTRFAGFPSPRRLGQFAAGAGLAIGTVVTLGYAVGTPLLYGGQIVPMALMTGLAFLALNGALLLTGPVEGFFQRWHESDSEPHVPGEHRHFTRRLVLTLAVIGALIVIAGFFYLRREQEDARLVISRQLEAIAQLKVQQIRAWRDERLGEAHFLQKTPAVLRDLANLIARPDDPAARHQLLEWLEPIKSGDRYSSISVLDAQGRLLLSLSTPADVPEEHLPGDLLAQVLASPDPVFGDLQRHSTGSAVHLDLLVPVRPLAASAGDPALGIIVLQLDPWQFLFPLIQHWPLPSDSAESFIVRREGDHVVFLSELRHRPGAALTLRLSASEPHLPAAMALRGKTEVSTGLDYRGVAVLAVSRPVPSTPWILIAKVDQAEVYAPIQRELWRNGLILGLLLMTLGMTGVTLWRQRHAATLRRALAAERARQVAQEQLSVQEARYRNLIESINQGYYVTDPRSLFTYFNPALVAMGGFQPDRLLGTSCFRLVAEEDRRRIISAYKTWSADPTAIDCDCEFRVFNKAGRKFWVEQTAHFKRDARGKVTEVRNIVRDITERKEHEREIERLNRMYLVISQVNQAIVRAKSSAGLFPEICRVLVELGQFKMAWIGWHDPATRLLAPVAVTGDEHSYVPDLRIRNDAAQPEGRGPTALAFRENRTRVCNDFMASEETAPWHGPASRSGFQSMIALPLRCEGRTVGVLTVYAAEKDFFDAQKISLLEEATSNVSFALDIYAGDEWRRRAEENLRQSERRLDFLVSASPAVIYSMPADGKFGTSFVSHNVREVVGYEPTTFTGTPGFWRANLHPDDARRADAHLATLAGTGTLTSEYRFRHADGTWRWMHDEVHLVRDADGQPIEYVGYWTDITESRQMADRLRHSEELYRLIAENTTDVIWLFDLVAGKFNYLSPSTERLLGYTREEMMNWHVHSVLTLESVAEARRVLRKRLAGIAAGDLSGVHHAGLYDIVRKDGTIRNGEVVSTILLNAAGQPTQFLGITRDITDRRQVESQLQKLSGAVEQSPTSIVITNLAGDIEYVNPWFTSLTGYTLEEVRGINPRVLKSGLTPGDTYDEMWRTLTAGKVWRGQLHNRKKNGENFVEQAVIAPVFGPDGRATHYVAIKDDITSRVRMESALHESEERFRAMFESSLDGLLLTLMSGEILAANPAACAMLGRTETEICQVGRGGLVDLEDPRLGPLLEERRRTGKARGELTFIRGDGTRFEAEISSAVFGTGAGQRNGMVLRDITLQVAARKTLERFNSELEQMVGRRTGELATRNREIQALLIAIPDTVMRLRADGTILHSQPARASPALAAITPGEQAVAAAAESAEIVAASLDLGRRALAAGTTTMGETEIATPGGPLALELRTAPTGPDEFVVFARDITARKRLESETAAMLEKERQVAEMRTRFISVISHEFRTPLTAIMGSVELLANHLDHLSPEKRAEIFERIDRSQLRMTAMLDDVLTLNRLDADRTEVRLGTIKLSPYVQNIIAETQAADHDAHRFAVHLPADPAPFVTDPNLLHHILSNLLGNAVRYSPAGSTVTVRVEYDAWRMHLSVEDQGIGIPPADRARIFEPFERGSNVGHIKGTGLGLNIVRRMTVLLGGNVTLRPVAGGGTRFSLALPLLPPPSFPAAP